LHRRGGEHVGRRDAQTQRRDGGEHIQKLSQGTQYTLDAVTVYLQVGQGFFYFCLFISFLTVLQLRHLRRQIGRAARMSLIHYVDMAEGSRGSVGGVDAALNKMFPPRCARARVAASAREGGERAYDAALALVSMGCCSGFALICARVTPQWREAAAVYLRATRCPRPLCRVERRASAPTPSSSNRGRPALTYPPPPPPHPSSRADHHRAICR